MNLVSVEEYLKYTPKEYDGSITFGDRATITLNRGGLWSPWLRYRDPVDKFMKGIKLLQRLRLHYLVHRAWHYYWYDQRDEKGYSRACKHVAKQLVE